MSNTGPEAGWYPDPTMPGTERWWDGYEWSDAVRPAVPAAPPPTPVAPQPAGLYGGPGSQPSGDPQPAYPDYDQHPPEPEQRSGCRTVTIVIGVLLALLLLGIVAAAALIFMARSSDDGASGDGANDSAIGEEVDGVVEGDESAESQTASTALEPEDDTGAAPAQPEESDVLSCARLNADTIVLEVVNSSSETSNYAITVGFFDDSGARLADEPSFVNNLRPGERSIEEHLTFEEEGTVCEILNVDRFESLSLAGDLSEVSECAIGSEPDTFGDFTATLTATNNSAETSDYLVDVAFVDPDGIRRGTGSSFIEAVRPGESAPSDVFSTVDYVSGYTCEVVSVSRTAS